MSKGVKGYRDLDYRLVKTQINESSSTYGGDPYFKGTYFGGTITPEEAIFFKNNRW